VQHVAPGHSAKAIALRSTVRTQFQNNRDLTDAAAIETAKAGAVRALANYMVFQSGAKDAHVSQAMNNFHQDSVQQAKNIQLERRQDEKESGTQ
jgi:hypothetical protein